MSSFSLAPDAASHSLKRARELFDKSASSAFLPSVDEELHEIAIARRLRTQYNQKKVVDATINQKKKSEEGAIVVSSKQLHGVDDGKTEVFTVPSNTSTSGVLARLQEEKKAEDSKPRGILVKHRGETSIPTPTWHAPWQLSTVLSSHLGWVRSVAFDPTNEMFATGGGDRVVKVWDLAKASVGAPDALKITLTGHISPVRGLAFSERHPYLFSAGEDKQVKCWDLETNQVIRHYHGHLSGIFALSLHPTLDVLVTGGRDAVARVWDMRSKTQIHVLSGHDHTVASILTKSTDPQIITGSHDTTIKMWDLAAGKCFTTLTHHQKSIRALAQPSFEHTFMSGAADCLKKWQGKDGRFLKSFRDHNAVINALAINDDGVLVSGGDDGSLRFWDYETGYCFQDTTTIAQPGSLEAENGVYATAFDLTGTRLITCEADKTVKIWKQDDSATDASHPIDMSSWRKQCIAESKMRY
eukprot:CAMPEP_0194207474 /NCGR_PEP_ID=MMETSP0156-20130528/6197_1 /TAXON_ID=33649 /ORGANISM="Thalassionema nitzschioides, Strain L26-B" /LENGTH=469 /DNA_ID=CAMNT_0038934247 /DNA_START=133 /DNA_END=1542 /DNA_ORIENTATION=-